MTASSLDLVRLSSFSNGNEGGNPAGVVFFDRFPDDEDMLRIAADVGYSETAFLRREGDSWRVRYFAPEVEVAFCGHATIALGAELGARLGAGEYRLVLNDAEIAVRADRTQTGGWTAALTSPPTWSRPLAAESRAALLTLFSLNPDNLDPSFPVSVARAGATHAVVPLRDRTTLARMEYPFEPVKTFMAENDLTTISLIFIEEPTLIHARNAFAIGGVVEDPATGAAAAALGGLLRDLGRLDFSGGAASFEIRQGEDMGAPSRLRVEAGPEAGSPVAVSGAVRRIEAA